MHMKGWLAVRDDTAVLYIKLAYFIQVYTHTHVVLKFSFLP